jgi:hypothetical protein
MWAQVRKGLRIFLSSSLWLVVLVPILAVSAYSLYWVARHFGVPWYFAMAMSTCFDGVALLAADYSVKYAQSGLSGSWPRTVVRIFALTAAFLQTYHARLGDEPAGSWVLWAALPLGAVTVYEIHIRWERRRALARMGVIYPAPLPSFGLVTWVMFPTTTYKQLKEIVGARRAALASAASAVIDQFAKENAREIAKPRVEPREVVIPAANGTRVDYAPVAKGEPARLIVPDEAPAVQPQNVVKINAHRPVAHIRAWAKSVADERGWRVGDKSPLPRYIHEAYREAVERGDEDGEAVP